ncbi:MAG: hypothetical protein ACJAVR_003635 [Paracoccaceae bacterium]|jgi:hypothetical protein
MKNSKDGLLRRDFLKFAGTAAPAAVAALVVGADGAEAAEVVESTGMRTTEHTRKYLESTRF